MPDANDVNPPVELEEASQSVEGKPDARPRVPEPLPVRLIAIEDVRLLAPAGVEEELDAFYVGLLLFVRVEGELTYRADNFDLKFEVREAPVVHDSLRPTGVEVLSLAETEKKLIDREIEYIRQRGTVAGLTTLLVLDPAGNWVEISENRVIH